MAGLRCQYLSLLLRSSMADRVAVSLETCGAFSCHRIRPEPRTRLPCNISVKQHQIEPTRSNIEWQVLNMTVPDLLDIIFIMSSAFALSTPVSKNGQHYCLKTCTQHLRLFWIKISVMRLPASWHDVTVCCALGLRNRSGRSSFVHRSFVARFSQLLAGSCSSAARCTAPNHCNPKASTLYMDLGRRLGKFRSGFHSTTSGSICNRPKPIRATQVRSRKLLDKTLPVLIRHILHGH